MGARFGSIEAQLYFLCLVSRRALFWLRRVDPSGAIFRIYIRYTHVILVNIKVAQPHFSIMSLQRLRGDFIQFNLLLLALDLSILYFTRVFLAPRYCLACRRSGAKVR